MTYPNCTPEAEQLFASLIESGRLTDFYSEEYANVERYWISPESLPEYDDEYGPEYRHHLLIYFVEPNSDESNALADLYPGLKEAFDPAGYQPNIIYINLAIQKARCVGVARRGNFFSTYYDLVTGRDDDCEDDFFAMDYHDIGGELVDVVEQIATANYNLWSDETDEGLIQDALDQGPDEDGLYHYREDDEGVTLKEIKAQQKHFAALGKEIDASIAAISKLFPKLAITNDDFVVDE